MGIKPTCSVQQLQYEVTMQFKCLVYISLIVAVHSASITKQDIPVKVVYEKPQEYRNYASVRNLDEKNQLSPEELKIAEVFQNKQSSEETRNPNAVKNLDEKVQLSLEDLELAYKHIPVQETIDEYSNLKIVTSDEETDNDIKETKDNEILNDAQLNEKIQEIIKNGVKKIKENVRNSEDGKSIKPEIWNKLDNDVDNFIKSIKERGNLRQSQNQNFFNTLISQFQNITSGFVSTVSNGQENVQSDTPQQTNRPGWLSNVIQSFQSGIFSLAGQQQQGSTVLGAVTTQSNNPLHGIVNQTQQVFSGVSNLLQPFNNLNPFNQTPAPGSQSDETTQHGPFQTIQNVFNQLGETINNFNPLNQVTQSPGTQSNETTQNRPLHFFQNLANQAGQTFNNFNLFNQQSSTKAPVEADPTKNPIQAVVENVGSQITQGISNPLQGSGNPAQVVQGIAEQVGEAINSNNPLPGNNPLQGVVSQIGEAINNPLQGGNPIQNVASQIGETISSNNPLQGNNPLQAVATQVGEAISSNNPLQVGDPAGALQNVAGQIGQAISSNNPLTGINNPLQGVTDQLGSTIQTKKSEELLSTSD